MKQQGFLFWQPKKNFLKFFCQPANGFVLLFLNYAIWFFLFFLSLLLIGHQSNLFWQLLVVTVLAETIERFGKKCSFWPRPLYKKTQTTPKGLVRCWYNGGSFPSGHATKAAYFFLFLLQYQVFNPALFLLIVIPLIIFRVLVGFHYPIDILAGFFIGFILWFIFKDIVFPDFLNLFIKTIFDTIFFVK